MSKVECCICLESNYVCKTPCKHDICAGCLVLLVNKDCPMCRKPLINLPKNILEANKRLAPQKNLSVFDTDDFPPLS